MQNDVKQPAAPTSAAQETTGGETADGDMQNGVTDSLTQVTLDLLALLPSLL